MLRRALLLSATIALVHGVPASPAMAADETADADMVKRLVEEAAALVATSGVDTARPILQAEGHFRHGDIYVVVIDLAGNYLIFPPKPGLEGQNVLNVKDADGKMLVREMVRIATEDGEGWTEYRWLNPALKKIQPKVSFIKRVPGKDLIAFGGIYK